MAIEAEQTILLLGGTGQIGHELRRTLDRFGRVEAPGRDVVDLTAPASIRDAVQSLSPDLVVNAAAYTAVDEAEEEKERAAALNVDAPRILAEETRKVGGWFVHYSTDYVFDGTKTAPYDETDAPNPINEYGRTKWRGEKAIRDVSDRYLLLRTSWVYSDRRSNFLLSMLRLAEENETLTVVDDQIGTPTWAGWIADATGTIVEKLLSADEPDALSGLYHLAASGQTSWYGFARAIFEQFERPDVSVEPISTDEYPTPARRPLYTALNSRSACDTFELAIPTWSEQLARMRAMTAERGSLA